ncbi:MAG: hypothetical protein WCA93_03495 [Acidimicrobiia bacterium]
MSDTPRMPEEALAPEELQRFMYACSHERRSPTTQRLIDASSYGWIHFFIRSHGENATETPRPDDWLEPHDADPAKLSEFFKRVGIRLRDTDAHEYATSLEQYFHQLADERDMPWPYR